MIVRTHHYGFRSNLSIELIMSNYLNDLLARIRSSKLYSLLATVVVALFVFFLGLLVGDIFGGYAKASTIGTIIWGLVRLPAV